MIFENSYKIYPMALDLMITVGYLYQDRSAFIKAMIMQMTSAVK